MKFAPIKILLKGGAEHEITEFEYQLLCGVAIISPAVRTRKTRG